ncbi:MAG: hypothetical protein ACK4RK_09405 [Gemmataceae bacterium]
MMMKYQTEAKFQGWRALAIFTDNRERLVYLGRSSSQVRAGYLSAFLECFDEAEQAEVRAISLQRWEGAADIGRWVQQTTLALPAPSAARAKNARDTDNEYLAASA